MKEQMIQRIALLILLVVAASLFLLITKNTGRLTSFQQQTSRKQSTNERPNILLISIDTLRADHLGCYGYGRPTSPVIDALARTGVLFESAYSHSSNTATSHMSLMTGLYPEEHGVAQLTETGGERLSDSIPTLATLLKKNGYQTMGITGGGNVRAELGFDQGMGGYDYIAPLPEACDRAISVIRQFTSPKNKGPFFLFLHTYSVHDPYIPPSEYSELFLDPGYRGAIIGTGEELQRLTGSGNDFAILRKLFWSRVNRKMPEDLRRLQDLYDGAIRYTDGVIGQFLLNLEKSKVLDNTLIVFLSDHGEEFLDHGRFGHTQMYQELLHVPLILIFPKTSPRWVPPHREKALVRLVDVMPTILELARVSPPPSIHGISLVPLLQGKSMPAGEVYSSLPPGLVSLRMNDQKSIVQTDNTENTVVTELYFMNEDPGERRDVSTLRPEAVLKLQQRIDAIKAEGLAFRGTVKKGPQIKPDQETIDSLRALGYLSSDGN